MKCDCEDWVKWIPFLDGAVILANIHEYKLPKDYVYWKYCPWCGRLLQPDTVNMLNEGDTNDD